MSERLRAQIRRGLLAVCLAAVLPLAWRWGEVARELQRDHLAAVLFQRGTKLQAEDDLNEAAAVFRSTIAIAPMAVEVYGSLAEVEFKRGRVDAAVQTYRQLLAIYPYMHMASLYREVGLIELRGGLLEDARRDLVQTVALEPEDWLAHHFLGHVYYRLGDRAGARAAWRRVVALQPGYQPAYEQLRRLDTRSP